MRGIPGEGRVKSFLDAGIMCGFPENLAGHKYQ